MSVSELVLVANTRMPSKRAQALQVAQVSGAFARAGTPTTLYFAQRSHTEPLPPDTSIFEYYGVESTGSSLPVKAHGLGCLDWIDAVPRALQYLPARLQEWTFARSASRRILAQHRAAFVLSREIETAAALVRAGHPQVFLEVHRVPGGRLRRAWLSEAAQGGRGILAISAGVRDDLARMGIPLETIRVEHDGFEPARFEKLPRREAARAQLGLEVDRPTVVYTGGLMEWKGVDVLVDAARELPEVQFVIAGGMEADVARIRERARSLANVRIDGFQPPSRVATYLAAGDIGAVPNRSKPAISARYTSPLKVFESFACGLPLVASDLPSLRESVVDGQDGVLVQPDDAGALAEGIRRLVLDVDLRERIAAHTRERSRDHTWDARARRILDWMEERT